MRWKYKRKKGKWRTCFAIFPTKVEGTWVWLERYAWRYDAENDILEHRFYEGCAENVGYPCDCYRH